MLKALTLAIALLGATVGYHATRDYLAGEQFDCTTDADCEAKYGVHPLDTE